MPQCRNCGETGETRYDTDGTLVLQCPKCGLVVVPDPRDQRVAKLSYDSMVDRSTWK